MPDFLRLVIGTLTRFPVPAPRRIDERSVRAAMLSAPLIGLLLGGIAVVVLDGVRVLAAHGQSRVIVDLLAAVIAVASLAFMTRGLHLDGLADTFDALGVKGPDDEQTRTRRLDVMRSPEIGAFGVIAVVLCLMVQVTALAACVVAGLGSFGLLTAAMASRLALTLSCRPSIPSARSDGLGATVAGSVPAALGIAVSVAVIGLAAVFGRLDDDASWRTVVALTGSVVVAIATSQIALRMLTRAFGGVTGDVFGAITELSFAASLLTTACLF
jgi:adenosylcobinamide-GDP ribazoletransferase